MASSIIHLAVTNELTKRQRFRDETRLRLGSILPDAACDKKSGHMKIAICNGSRKTYDLEGYRRQFMEDMARDDLYLGYYLHLIQDILYRKYMYAEHDWKPHIPGNVERLHRDYAISNLHVINRYGLKEDMAIPIDITGEKLARLGAFDVPGLVQSVRSAFVPVEGTAAFFTAEMADEYIERAIVFCLKELEAMENGSKMLDSAMWAWENPSSGGGWGNTTYDGEKEGR